MNTININLDALTELPGSCIDRVRYALKKLALEREICADLNSGMSLSEAINSRLPAGGAINLQQDAAELEAGVNSVYREMDQHVDEKWVSSQLNSALRNLDVEQRGAYLKKMMALLAYNRESPLSEEAQAVSSRLSQTGNLTDDDVDAAIKVLYSMLDEGAGILERCSVQAMEKMMGRLPEEDIIALSEQGKKLSYARAAATYILRRSGEYVPMDGEPEIEKTLFQIGASSAASVESSKLLALYYQGKLTLKVLCDKLHDLYLKATTYVSEHLITVLAGGLQIYLMIYTDLVFFSLFLDFLSPALACFLALGAAYYLTTKVITTKDIQDGLEFFRSAVQIIWELATKLFRRIIGRVSVEESNDENTEEKTSVSAETEEADEDAETTRQLYEPEGAFVF